MLWLLALSLLSAATLGSVLAYQRGMTERLGPGAGPRKALPPKTESPTTERTLQTLQPGDVVLDGNEDWLIVSTATYREEEDTWWVHVLDDGAQKRLMEVREREGWRVTLFERADDVPTFGQLGMGLTFRQQSFHLQRRGDARVDVEGQENLPRSLIRYATYAGPGGAHLNIEERDAGRTAFIGEEVPATDLMLMPGESPEVAMDADLETR